MDLGDAKLTMAVVGMTHVMGALSLLVWCVLILLLASGFSFLEVFHIHSVNSFQQDNEEGKCTCPPGFKGDGVKNCEGKRVFSLSLSLHVEVVVSVM